MSRRRNQASSQKRVNPSTIVLFLLLIIVTSLNFYFYNFLNILILIALLLIPSIAIIVLLIRIVKPKKKYKNIIIWIILIIYTIIALFGIYAHETLSAISTTSETSTYYVLTLKENEADDISDIPEDATIGILSEIQYGAQNPTEELKEKGYNFTYEEDESALALANALYDDTYEYIIIPTLNDPAVLEDYPAFEDETKVLLTEEKKVEIDTSDKDITKDPYTILITGTDTRVNAIDQNSRSDAILLAAVNPETRIAELVSIPRDAYVQSSCLNNMYDKLTHSSVNGIQCTINDVSNLLGVEVDFYAKVNFTTVIDAIDTVGGINVDVDTSFCAQDENDNADSYCFNPGSTHMSGEEALAYSRERKSLADGDYSRTYHQQQVVSGFVDAVGSSGISTYNQLLGIVEQSARTNIPADELIDGATDVSSNGSYTINNYTVEGTGGFADLPQWGYTNSSVQYLTESSVTEATKLINETLEGETTEE